MPCQQGALFSLHWVQAVCLRLSIPRTQLWSLEPHLPAFFHVCAQFPSPSQEVSERVYRILVRYTSCVQPLSCDEALLDVTGLTGGDPEAMAKAMRAEIEQATGCTASVGECCRRASGCTASVRECRKGCRVQGQ